MMTFLKSIAAASSGMQTQAERLRVVSENVANADTPGYQRKLVSFKSVLDRDADATRVSVDRVSLDDRPLREVYDPSHPMADETGHVRLSNVELLTEIADAREAQRSFEANLNIFDQAKRMYGGVLDLLRRQ